MFAYKEYAFFDLLIINFIAISFSFGPFYIDTVIASYQR